MPTALLAKIGLPVLINVISETLLSSGHNVARSAGDALRDLGDAILRGEVSQEDISEMNRHTENLAQLKSDEYRMQISEINQSLRAEVASNDPYVRRMRPTFCYLMAFTWAAQMLALAWIILQDPVHASLVMQGFESLSVIWSVGLSVLGIYVYKRSEDKMANQQMIQSRFMKDHETKSQRVESVPEPVPAKVPQGRVYNN